MTSTAHVLPTTIDLVPEVQVPAWAWLVVAFSLFAIYMVTLENGALLGSTANYLHEFMHDGRHFGAVPCH
ncbi:CbtB-domain containing protein [Acidimicrobiales bacterium]|jgi:hypothetical protein|nr:CbtB-domain containing protein [Acidimicrobiales bacterium]